MARRVRRNTGGNVRKLPSGRYQVRVRDQATNRLVPLGTCATKADADAKLRVALSQQERGSWISPHAGTDTVGEYVADWITNNRRITSPRTRERYEGALRLHIVPQLGDVAMNKVTPSMIRNWHADLVEKRSVPTAAKAYRLLRAAFNTALADELVTRNPCKVEGGGLERSAERPIATVAEVNALAEAAPDRWSALILVAAWTSLRFGELAALTRADVNLLKGTISVSKNRQTLDDGTSVVLPPKTGAGARTLAIPPPLKPVLQDHLDRYSEPGPNGVVFVGEKGAPMDRSRWNEQWRQIRAKGGRPDLKFHDLRHTGNVLAAATGATTKQLMARMGHASMAAAIRYQHATEDADQAIAAALGDLMKAHTVADVVELGAPSAEPGEESA